LWIAAISIFRSNKVSAIKTISVSRINDKIPSWQETAAGLLPIIILSIAVCLEGAGNQSILFPVLGYIFILLLFALPAGFLPIAWEGGIPRWSSPYLGLVMLDLLLLFPIYFTRLFGNFWGMLSLRLAISILLLYFGYRLVTVLRRRSNRKGYPPEVDWTQFIFILHPLSPIVLMIIFDEIDFANKAIFLLLGGLILAVGSFVYLRARKPWLGIVALVGSALLVLVLGNLAARWYWLAHTWG
jgi:hypothetical protein